MNIIEKMKSQMAQNKPFFSLEFFPPKTETGLNNLYARIERISEHEPMFVDITWGAGGSTSELTLEISHNLQKFFGLDVMMHLTCTGMTRQKVKEVLTKAKEKEISNILALRGDPPHGHADWKAHTDGFNHANELVEFINEEFPDTFGVAVAAYPEGHVESVSLDHDLAHLKIKAENADFIVTQMFYDIDDFQHFVDKCRELNITCPIIPGVMPIHNYQRFLRFIEFSQVSVPEAVMKQLDKIKDNDEEVREFGVKFCVEMCQELLSRGAPGVHFYTLNLESSVSEVLEKLGFLEDTRSRKALPWRPSTYGTRRKEDVRPIFWSNRPKSYVQRTQSWDDYPNGRWGHSSSPTFGALDHYLSHWGRLTEKEKDLRLQIWGTPKSQDDVHKRFVAFCEGKITKLPWCQMELRPESARINQDLVYLNKSGYLTINSQPQINGIPSTDKEIGWGGKNGFIYQKAYVELFTTKEKLEALVNKIQDRATITYQAINLNGDSLSNTIPSSVNAVTWGVFPGKEIVQPTVVDHESFLIWKEEAFSLWESEWMSLYPKDSTSHQVLKEIKESYYLVNIVENDYVTGDLFGLFHDH